MYLYIPYRCKVGQPDALQQGSGTYGSRARCGSFDDCIWLSQIKLEFEKLPNFSSSSDVAPPRRVAELISTNDASHLSSI